MEMGLILAIPVYSGCLHPGWWEELGLRTFGRFGEVTVYVPR